MEIRRTLGELKNLVIDAEQKDESTCYKVPITLTKDEVSRIVRENVAEIVLGFAKRIAQDNDACASRHYSHPDDLLSLYARFSRGPQVLASSGFQ